MAFINLRLDLFWHKKEAAASTVCLIGIPCHFFCFLLLLIKLGFVAAYSVILRNMLQGQTTTTILKFTAEISDSEIAFLDTKVYKGERFNRDSTLDVQTHYKQTETFQYTKFLFVSSTRRKERIHKRRGAVPPKNKFVTLDV